MVKNRAIYKVKKLVRVCKNWWKIIKVDVKWFKLVRVVQKSVKTSKRCRSGKKKVKVGIKDFSLSWK